VVGGEPRDLDVGGEATLGEVVEQPREVALVGLPSARGAAHLVEVQQEVLDGFAKRQHGVIVRRIVVKEPRESQAALTRIKPWGDSGEVVAEWLDASAG
jgi:hypothetical protein